MFIIKETLAFRVLLLEKLFISFIKNGVSALPLILFFSAITKALSIHSLIFSLLIAFISGTLLKMSIDYLCFNFEFNFKKLLISDTSLKLLSTS